MYILIDTKNSRLIARCQYFETLAEHAIHEGLDAYAIGPEACPEAFSDHSMGFKECDSIAERYHTPLPDKSNLVEARRHVLTLGEKHATLLKVDTPPPPPDLGPGGAGKTVIQKEFTRPKAGGITARVWEIADGIEGDPNSKSFREALIAACAAENIKKTTATAQFNRWKKVNANKINI